MAVAAVAVAIIAGASAAAAAYAAGLALAAVVAIGIGTAALSYISSSQMMNVGQMGVSYPSTGSNNARSTSPSTGIPISYGGSNRNATEVAYNKLGSIVVWQNVYKGTSNQLCTVHAISIGEIGQVPGEQSQGVIKQIYFDNAPVLMDGAYITTEGIIPTSMMIEKYRKYLQIEVRFGKPSYGGSMTLARQYGGSQWTDNMRGDGLVQICTVINKTNDSLIDGILTNQNYTLSVEMRGRLIYDLTDNVRKPSSNPPSQLYDFITNTEFGFGLDPNDIDITSFRNMANYCAQNNFYSNGNIQYDKSFKENIENILQTFGGVLYESNGKYYLTVDAPDIPVKHFDESSIIGGVNITTGSKSEYFNCMDSTYTNPGNDYSQDIIRYPSNALNNETIAKDGYIIKKDLNYLWVQDKTQLATLSNIELLKSKYISNTITFNTYVSDLKVFDVFTIDFEEAGFSNNKYRCVQRTVPMTVDKTGIIQITAISYADGVYQGKDPGQFPQDGLTNLPNPTYVEPPSNLKAQRLGATATGNAVLLTWDLSQDTSVRGYKIRYKRSDSGTWVNIGNVGQYSTSFEILNLLYGVQYDFAIEAYNTLGYSSELVAIYNQTPQVIFALPKITNLNMVNDDVGLNQTYAQDFIFRWDGQSNVAVNGKTFTDFFKHYEIRVYDRYRNYITSYYTTTSNWTYTFAMNTSDGLSRYRVFGIIAHGWGTGIYSEEVQIEVSNPQHPQILGITLRNGYENVFIDWTESNIPDYSGIVMQIAKDEGFSSDTHYFSSSNRYSASFGVEDGSWFARVAAYDVFGQDELVWSPTIGFNQNTKVPYSKLNDDVIDGLLNSDKATGIVEKQIVDELGSRWQLQVSNNGNVTGIALAADEKTSVFTVMADRFSVISTDSAKQSDKVYPFVIQNGKTYINSAVIADASINTAQINNLAVTTAKIQNAAIDNTKIANAAIRNAHIMNGEIDSAKISQQIQSSNWDGSNGWMINKNGTANFSNATVRGTIFANSGVLNNVTINENCNILGTLSATRIVGDVCRPQSTGIQSNQFLFGSKVVSGGTVGLSPVPNQHYVALRIRGEDFDRYLDSNMSISLASYERQYFYIRMGGNGIGLTNLAYIDAGNDGHNTPYTYRLNGVFIPRVGRGNWNYIYVMCTTSRGSTASLNVPADFQAWVYRAGDQPLYN
ncbi:fibronectin type III domain-containing protein [Cronobacter sakazakii]|uniref:phage tail tip fiber protein n=1 Tax=Cronobacter sakazakii TaxID=28141 RepID=UPI002893CBDC|nr:fibronectin type III domain-containing protein [Cronobacter sakazakii]MDT3546909.1 fibronectin type III domain-containing protein [Cronobacter sakazakii]MDT3633798.1 fibronectin type III domain-containing protein [Cronobacter sakazakii]